MSGQQDLLPSMPPPPPHWINAVELTPPPIPSGKHIYVFGVPINRTHEARMAQDETFILETTKKDKIETRVSALKQLNRTMLVKYLQLTKVLVQSPSDCEKKVRELKATMMNFQYLLNQYRPHEARETIITMLEKQLERRKEILALLKERISAADAEISDAKTRLSKQLIRIDLEPSPTSSSDIAASITESLQESESNESQTSQHTLSQPVDSKDGLKFIESYLDNL